MPTYVVKNLSETEAKRVEKLYKLDGCSTQRTKQTDGKLTVTATCPAGVDER